MKVEVKNLSNKKAGNIELDDAVFGLEPRRDLLARVVNWQLAKRRAGTHKTRSVSEISGTGAKPFRQKGSGKARQGSLRSVQFRGGAVAHGPVVRSHAHDLPKKVRRLGLKVALSTKQASGQLVVLDTVDASGKTKDLKKALESFGWVSVLVIGGEQVDDMFARAARNIPLFDVLPCQGANVYDILRRETLVLTTEAVQKLEARLK